MADAKGIRAGAAYVELSVKDNRLIKGLDAAAKKLKAFGASVAKLGAGLVALGEVALDPVAGMVFYFKDAGDALHKMAARTGVSTEALSELSFAAEQSGADLATLEAGLKAMQKAIGAGLGGPDLANMTPEEQFLTLAERISKIDDPTKRAALAMDVFGKAGQKLIPLLSAGAKGIDELRAEARMLGLTVSTDQAQAAANLQDAWNRMVRVIKATTFVIGGSLAPVVTDLLGRVLPVAVAVGRWARENGRLIMTVAGVSAALVLAGASVIAFGAVLSGAGTILGTISAAVGLVGTALGAVLSPIGLVVTAVVGLGLAWLLMSDRGKAASASVADAFRRLADEFSEVWSGIVSAIRAGDLEAALEIVALSMRRIWAGVMLSIREGWNNLLKGIAKTLKDNPWILPLAGTAVGFRFGGPLGAVAGLAAGVAGTAFADGIADALSVELDEATARLDEAKRRLKDRVERAKELAPLVAQPSKPPSMMNPDELRAQLVGARGAFATPFAAGQLGLDDRIKKQEDLLDDLVGEVKQIKDIIRGGLEFK